MSLLEVTKTAFMGLKEGMPIASEVRTSVSGKCFFEIPHEIMVGFFSVSSFNSDEVSLFFEPGHNPLDCPLRPAEVGCKVGERRIAFESIDVAVGSEEEEQ